MMKPHDLTADTTPDLPEPWEEPNARPIRRALLRTGRASATPEVLAALAAAGVTLETLVERHHFADWGHAEPSRWMENDRALLQGREILSVYQVSSTATVWIRTSPDRSVTTVTLASEP